MAYSLKYTGNKIDELLAKINDNNVLTNAEYEMFKNLIKNGGGNTGGSSGGSYTLPIATSSRLGGIKVGSGLSINATTGVLSTNGLATEAQLASKVDKVDGSRLLTYDESVKISNIDSQINNLRSYIDRQISDIQVNGGGMTAQQVSNLNTAYAHSQSTHVSMADIPKATSDLINDSNFTVRPNFSYKINMIESTRTPSVTTTGVYPNLVITFNIPSGGSSSGGDTPVVSERLWIGYIPYDETGAAGYYDVSQVGSNMTMNTIRFGINAGTIEERDPNPDSNTNGNLIVAPPEGSYLCVVYPADSGLRITADNGIGNKVPFSQFTGNLAHQEAVQLTNQINGVTYLITGMLITGVGNYTIYIDREV